MERLQMPYQIQWFPPNTKVLGAYAKPDFNTSMSLSNLLIYIIFPASKA